nr:unnamed protein product [Spirometra erinaceieuropaei]
MTAETFLAMLIGLVGIIANIGILSITKLIGRVPRKKLSSGGYSTDETASEVRNARISLDMRRPSETKFPSFFSSGLEVKHLNLLSPCSKASLFRLSSLLSINKLGQEEQMSKDKKVNSGRRISCRWRSRRHQKYLQGLIIVAFCNIFLSVTLLLKAAGMCWSYNQEVVDSRLEEYPPWQRFCISLGLMLFLDIFQAAEIGAIMWIAINRAGAIHNTSRRNNSRYSQSTQSYVDRPPNNCCTAGLKGLLCGLEPRRREQTGQVNMIMSTRHGHSRTDGNAACCPLTRKAGRTFRCIVCLLPAGVIISSAFLSLADWTAITAPVSAALLYYANASVWSPLAYYTPNVSVGILFGHFLLPVVFLVTTNILIYRKVSLRQKRFCSRRSSHNGRTNCLYDDDESCSAILYPSPFHSPMPKPSDVPRLTITQSSDTDINTASSEAPPLPDSQARQAHSCSPPRKFASTVPPLFLQTLSPLVNAPQLHSVSAVDISSLQTAGLAQPNGRDVLAPNYSLHLPSAPGIGPRRKSFSDAISATKTQLPATTPLADSPNHTTDVKFLDLLRRQHRRTVIVLVIILCVYLVCHGPRFLALCLHLQLGKLPPTSLSRLLQWRSPETVPLLAYATLWSRLCTLIDPIVYGFWGNRAYRECLRNLSRRMIWRR